MTFEFQVKVLIGLGM